MTQAMPARAEAAEAAPGRAAHAVRRLDLATFRSYATLRLEAGQGATVLTGPNGAGKTNVLEAISFLAPGRGLRGVRLTEVASRGAEGWSVAARIDGPGGTFQLGTGIARGPQPVADTDEVDVEYDDAPQLRRTFRIDGQPARGAAIKAGSVAVLWATPEQDRLFLDSASARRRVLDRLVVALDPEHAKRVSGYTRALRERAKLLRDGAPDPAWLAALEETIAAQGVAVAAARNDAVDRLRGVMAEARGPFPAAAVAIEGKIEALLRDAPAIAVEERFRALLRDSRPRDAEAGGAAEGPHRADLALRHLAKDMPAELCSTGEQKALLLALVFAEARLIAAYRGVAPILLFDEVAAHLDETRRLALFAEIAGLGAQAWLTGTDLAPFAALAGLATYFAVADGRVIGTPT
ncbi:MAG: DNA replication/repair protein RecF [Alphaproteobacteria bacterium]|nr:DNA replication/repair protein RecF [Alphaproteobacteria bacterium]